MTKETISGFDPVGSHTLEAIAKADKFNHWMYQAFRSLLKGEVLEIGSGIGNISAFVIADGHPITLSDYNEEYVAWLRQQYGENKAVRDILQIDLLDPDFKNSYRSLEGKFDSIFLLNVIEHLKDDNAAVENCRYLLKRDGHLIVLAPAYQWLYCSFDKELGHFRRYTLKRMTTLLRQKGFEIKKKQYFNFAGIGGWVLFGKILRRKMIGGEMSTFNSIVPLARLVDRLIFNVSGLSVIVTGKKSA
jgi:2-polyprenyl-3-methyl-5-hydroxy-6-metoxy-1,4-benzoquinol methylase